MNPPALGQVIEHFAETGAPRKFNTSPLPGAKSAMVLDADATAGAVSGNSDATLIPARALRMKTPPATIRIRSIFFIYANCSGIAQSMERANAKCVCFEGKT